MTTQTERPPLLDDQLRAQLLPELEMLRPLGTGATADVYLARETALQRLVAVKVLRADMSGDSVARQRFEREAQSAARIAHPNVTAIYRIGRLSDDIPFIVLEYIDGRTVKDIVESGSNFDLGVARTMLAAVASALAAAHDRGIIHRDVRAANVFVENRTARAVLADFGIAALLESGSANTARLTAAGVRLGDTRYMSPEQIRGDAVTEQSDVYSFGILAYEMLTGQGPFEAKSEAQMLAAHLQSPPRRLRVLRADIDDTLAALIERCLAKDPNHRPRALDIAKAIATPAGSAAAAPTGGPLSQFLGELRRRRVYQVLVAYAAVAVTVLGLAQPVYDAFTLSEESYRLLVGATLAGFPVALVLAWLYDIGAGGIHRTRSAGGNARASVVMWAALATSVALVLLIGWLLLGRRS